jgi:hypothetical protein
MEFVINEVNDCYKKIQQLAEAIAVLETEIGSINFQLNFFIWSQVAIDVVAGIGSFGLQAVNGIFKIGGKAVAKVTEDGAAELGDAAIDTSHIAGGNTTASVTGTAEHSAVDVRRQGVLHMSLIPEGTNDGAFVAPGAARFRGRNTQFTVGATEDAGAVDIGGTTGAPLAALRQSPIPGMTMTVP